MITPTVGRIVWYRPGAGDHVKLTINDHQPLAAVVACVLNDHMVNLTVSDHAGATQGRTCVPLLQEGHVLPPGYSGGYCEWMPYQKGQAAKAEQLEKQLAR